MRFLHSLCAASCAFLLSSSVCLAANEKASFSPEQVKQIEQVTHDYLLKNPKVIIEAVQTLQKQAMADEQKRVASIKDLGIKHSKEIFDMKAAGHVVVGNANPKVIVAEFVGYQCPVCRAAAPEVEKIMQNNKDMEIIFIPWNFEGDADIYAAQTALAAQKQGKFLGVHKALLALTGMLTKEQVDQVAKDNGVDMTKLPKDRDSQVIADAIKANFKLAQDLNLIGTPTIFATNPQQTKLSLLPGRASAEEIQKAIDEVK
jgi:protein-disulfide isomerase